MEELELENKSKFNTSLATIFLLADINKMLVYSTMQEDLKMQYSTLLSYFKLLTGVEKKRNIVESQRERWYKTRRSFEEIMKAKNGNQKVLRSDLDALHEWEIELNIWKQSLGLGIEKKLNQRFALLEE